MSDHSLELPSCTSSLCELESFIQRIAQRCNIKEERYPDILISLTEAVNNAIIHGNKEDLNKCVRIIYTHSVQGLSFIITDEGAGFDPQEVPDPTLEENLCLCGGRGVFLMKELSDKIEYLNNGRTVKLYFSF